MCAGISAGVSAAFGAPIGGALFSYELSKPSTFWTFSMIWRTFFCSAVSTYMVSLFNQIKNGDDLLISSTGTVKFGNFSDIVMPLQHIHSAFIIGILGGILGAIFINVNTCMGTCRKKYVNKPWKKVVETGLYGVATVSAMTALVILLGECN